MVCFVVDLKPNLGPVFPAALKELNILITSLKGFFQFSANCSVIVAIWYSSKLFFSKTSRSGYKKGKKQPLDSKICEGLSLGGQAPRTAPYKWEPDYLNNNKIMITE